MLLTKPEPIDWEIVDSNGATALHLAARRCNADIVQRLLEICPRGLCDRPTHDDGKPGSFTALQCAADLPRPPHWNEELRSAFKRTCAMLADAMSADGWCHVTTKGTTVSHPTHLFMYIYITFFNFIIIIILLCFPCYSYYSFSYLLF